MLKNHERGTTTMSAARGKSLRRSLALALLLTLLVSASAAGGGKKKGGGGKKGSSGGKKPPPPKKEEDEDTRTYYEILGLKKDCSESEIKKAYRKEAIKWQCVDTYIIKDITNIRICKTKIEHSKS